MEDILCSQKQEAYDIRIEEAISMLKASKELEDLVKELCRQ
jgi:hypothetical protein